ncbi:MAG: NHL repeat-containing protein [Polyangia bacterium]
MKRLWTLAAIALSLACSDGDKDPSGSADLGAAGSDGGSSSGGADLAGPAGPPGLAVLAGAIGGSGPADRIGADARLGSLTSVVADGAGTLYVGDSNGGTRKVVTATRAVTTLPTIGTLAGMALDGAGNLYGTPTQGSSIVKVVLATGVRTVLAGGTIGSSDGTGAAASFSGASGVAWDGTGSLYVADTSNNTIRKVVVATGAVTTVAGSSGSAGSADGTGTAAKFKQPRGVAWDGAGALYIADTGNYTIRKLVVATGAVTTVAGTAGGTGFTDGVGAAARFLDPTSLTWDGAGGLYITETKGYKLRKLVVATGAVSTVAGDPTKGRDSVDGVGTGALFYEPVGAAWDGTGSLYVADGYTVRKLDAVSGAVTTLAGTAMHVGSSDGTGAAARFSRPYAVAWDGAANLYVSDGLNFTIRKIVAATGEVSTLAGKPNAYGSSDGIGAAASFSLVRGLAADGAGAVYVADSSNNTIRKIVAATGQVSTLAGVAGMQGGSDGTGGAARFYQPNGLALDRAGNLFIADAGNVSIRKLVLATGQVTTLAGTPGAFGVTDGTGPAARFQSPLDLAWDGADSLYVVDGNRIRKIGISTAAVTTLAGGGSTTVLDGIGTAAGFANARNLAYDGAGNLYVSDVQTIRKVVTATAAVTTALGVPGVYGVLLGPFPAGFNLPQGVAFIPNLGLAVCDQQENAVLIARGL